MTRQGKPGVSSGQSGPRLKPVISIVDDDLSMRQALESLTRSLGFVSRSFASADDYLDSDARECTTCLISDVEMPRMSGWELQERLSREGRVVPIVFITAFPDEAVCAKVMKAGAVDYLLKPFNENELVSSIHLALSRNKWSDLWEVAGADAIR